MKEIRGIIDFYEQKKQLDLQCVLAMVIHVSGSSYRQVGARMLIVENGEWTGGISGGCLEGDVLKKAKAAMISGKSSIITYDTTQNEQDQIGVGLGCEGIINILILPINVEKNNNPIDLLKSCVHQRKRHILLTFLQKNKHLNVQMGDVFDYEKNDLPAVFQTAIVPFVEQVIQTKRSKIVDLSLNENNHVPVLIELLEMPIHLFIFGNSYDIYPLIELVSLLGWKISLVANLLKIDKKKLQLVDKAYHYKGLAWMNDVDERSAIVLMNHDYRRDAEYLVDSVRTKAAYIGLLGPKKRGEKLICELQNEGRLEMSEANKHRIHYPIGLDIGALNPEEIALSMTAEIQAFFSQRKGGFLHQRAIPIHAGGEILDVRQEI